MIFNPMVSGGEEVYAIQDNANQEQKFPADAKAGGIVKSTGGGMVALGIKITGEQSQEEIPWDLFSQSMETNYIFVMPKEDVVIESVQ